MPSFRNPFKRRKATPGAEPDLWVRCPGCSELLFKKTLEKSLRVCSACGHHFRVPARERIAQLVDEAVVGEDVLGVAFPEFFLVGSRGRRRLLLLLLLPARARRHRERDSSFQMAFLLESCAWMRL